MKNMMILTTIIGMTQCDGIPKSEGVSGFYAGKSNGVILMAGGANFPDIPVADGGTKVYHRHITTTDGTVVGSLPFDAAYGVAITSPKGIICVGGCDDQGSFNKTFLMQWDKKSKAVIVEDLPPFPLQIDNTSGALVGNRCYVLGGNADGVPTNKMFSIDINNFDEGWRFEPDFPGHPRVQPACAGQGAFLYVFGGFAAAHGEHETTLSIDCLRFDPSTNKWLPIATPTDNNETVFFGGGCAAAVGNNLIYCLGGVNKTIFLNALNGAYKGHYLRHESEWYHFNPRIMEYNVNQDTWRVVHVSQRSARAGASFVKENDSTYWLLQGEIMPGIRTSDNWKININQLNDYETK